jgi:hypothetical protein
LCLPVLFGEKESVLSWSGDRSRYYKLKEMEHRGITQVIFETDSKCVVDAVHTLCGGLSEFSSLIYNIKNVLMFFFGH